MESLYCANMILDWLYSFDVFCKLFKYWALEILRFQKFNILDVENCMPNISIARYKLSILGALAGSGHAISKLSSCAQSAQLPKDG